MLGRMLLPALFMASMVGVLMQLTCMWPVAALSRDLGLTAHSVLYGSAAALVLCNAISLPLMARRTVLSRPGVSVCFIFSMATGSLAGGSATMLTVASCTKDFFLKRLKSLSPQAVQTAAGRYFGGIGGVSGSLGGGVSCAAWPGCLEELAGHMRVLLLSTAFYNALACLLLVANACLIMRGMLVNLWLADQEAEAEAVAQNDEAEAQAAESNGAAGGNSSSWPGPRGELPPPPPPPPSRPGATLPIAPVWIAL